MIFSPFPLFATPPAPLPVRSVVDSSVYILQLGRGGALDRSSVTQEDLRQPYESWQSVAQASAGSAALYIAPPILLPAGFRTTQPDPLAAPTWLVPLCLAGNTLNASLLVSSVELQLRFDNALWQPVLISGYTLNYMTPPARCKSRTAFKDVSVYTGATHDPAGNTIHVNWNTNGSVPPSGWSAYPYMVINAGVPQPIAYLLMQRRTGTEAGTSLSMKWAITRAKVNGEDINAYIAQESGQPSYPQQDLGDNTQAQPVDWALSTPLIGDGKAQLKSRGVFAVLQSYGKATAAQVAGWPVGPYATVTTSDFKDFSAQQIDWSNGDPHEIQNIGAPRFRIEPNGTTIPTSKTGNNVATWGSSATPSAGNMLIDDAAVDTIATSEGVRGERFRSMLFGCMNSNGEQLKVSKVRIIVRQVGGLRRSGRRGLT